MAQLGEELWNFLSSSDDLPNVERILSNPSADVNWKGGATKSTPFYRACYFGVLEIVKAFLSDPRTDLNHQQYEGATGFLVACNRGHEKVVRMLLAHPAIEVALPMNDGSTAFLVASQNGHLGVVELLLQDDRIDVNQPMKIGPTPFFMACQNSHLHVVRKLLQSHRVDVRRPNNNRVTPLWIASQNGNLEIVKWMLASGRDVDVAEKTTQGKEGWNDKTAGEKAKINGHLKIASLLASYEADPVTEVVALRKELAVQETEAERQLGRALSNISWVFPGLRMEPANVVRLHLEDSLLLSIPPAVLGQPFPFFFFFFLLKFIFSFFFHRAHRTHRAQPSAEQNQHHS